MNAVTSRLREYALLMRLDRPIGILLLLWPTLWALWFAGRGHPRLDVLLVFVAGTVLMRSAGCVINDYADRDFDPHVTRTRNRPIAAGRVSPREALLLFAVLSLLAFLLVLTTNLQTILLAIPGAALAASYPFTKRYTYLPQAYLGVAFGWGIPMAYAAQTGAVPPEAWWLFMANVLWAIVYDSFYAIVDMADDIRIGVKSSAILFGRHVGLVTALLQGLVLTLLWYVGRQAGLGEPYETGLAAASFLAAYQQYLIRNRDPAACFRAFLNNNYFGAVIFLGLMADFLLR